MIAQHSWCASNMPGTVPESSSEQGWIRAIFSKGAVVAKKEIQDRKVCFLCNFFVGDYSEERCIRVKADSMTGSKGARTWELCGDYT